MSTVFKMESVKFWFTLHPFDGKWQVSMQNLTGKKHEKERCDTAELAMQWVWKKMWEQARTASAEEVSDEILEGDGERLVDVMEAGD
jgi:hypothetical protein